MGANGFHKNMIEPEIVAKLFKMYHTLIKKQLFRKQYIQNNGNKFKRT